MTGVRGRTPLHPGEITVLALAWAATIVLIAVLAAGWVNYAQYPITVLIIPGLAWAAVTAARAEWRSFGVGIAVAFIGAVGLLAGPAMSWLVAGVGLCAALLGNAAVLARGQRVTVRLG
ncbi:MAG: hypothetical protein ACYCU3_20615 [Streptosporangiaceae bacterium]